MLWLGFWPEREGRRRPRYHKVGGGGGGVGGCKSLRSSDEFVLRKQTLELEKCLSGL